MRKLPQTSSSEFRVTCNPISHRKGWSLADNEPTLLTFCANANRIHRITLHERRCGSRFISTRTEPWCKLTSQHAALHAGGRSDRAGAY